MKNYLSKIKSYIVAHKIISIIGLVIIILVGHWAYKKVTSTTGETRYITTKVEKGTIISSVSGSGQVSASNQVDIKSKAGGEVTYLGVVNGQKVNKGALIAQIDSKEAQKTVRDAEINLESAKLSLEKLKIQNSNENINADLAKAYDDGFSNVSSTFLDMPTVMNGLEDILGSNNLSEDSVRQSGQTAQDYRSTAEVAYYAAKSAFEKNQKDFRLVDHNSKPEDIENIINETYKTVKLVADTINDFSDLVDYLSKRTGQNSAFATYQESLSSYTGTISGHVSGLLSSQTSIESNKDAIPNADLDMQSSLLGIKQKENALQDAKDALADYSVRAPFDGTITVVNIKKSDSVGNDTAIATLITTNQIAEVSLNEIDVAKIKVGQKATLTFDAFEDLSITGQVIEVDAVGTVTQGVVSYEVKISFDTQNADVKSGMTVNTSIVTDVHQDVVEVPASAVKTQNGNSYVQVFDPELTEPTTTQGVTTTQTPKQVQVQIGISDDTNVEIISGLTEGQQIITRTISGTATTTPTTNSSNRGGTPRLF